MEEKERLRALLSGNSSLPLLLAYAIKSYQELREHYKHEHAEAMRIAIQVVMATRTATDK